MSWEPKYIVWILITTLITYIAGIVLEKQSSKKVRKGILIITVLTCIGILFVFKYFNFFSHNVILFMKRLSIDLNPITLNLILPVGISFYTFQALAYVIDISNGKTRAEHNLGVYATFIAFFPHLLAGPIERTEDLLPQIKSEKKFDYNMALCGARQMLWGFYKKIVVADTLSLYVNKAYSSLSECTGFDLIIAIFFFTIQIYCDFSGYSDIAIGTAKLMGIQLVDNFKSPYFSTSVKEFWSRWHISLSRWFKDYVYIPLGGNRNSKIKTYFNLLVTFLLSGLWHGANWTFIIWGGIHGIAQIVEKILNINTRYIGKTKRIMYCMFVFAFCNLAWIFFRADSVHDALFILLSVFGNIFNTDFFLHTSMGLSKGKLLYLLSIILGVAIYDYMSLKIDINRWLGRVNVLIRLAIEYLLVALIFFSMLDSSGATFVYFQF